MVGGSTESLHGDTLGNGPSGCSQTAQYAGTVPMDVDEPLFWQARQQAMSVVSPLTFSAPLDVDAQTEHGGVGSSFATRDLRKKNMSG